MNLQAYQCVFPYKWQYFIFHYYFTIYLFLLLNQMSLNLFPMANLRGITMASHNFSSLVVSDIKLLLVYFRASLFCIL